MEIEKRGYKMSSSLRGEKGFTLIELVLIIVVLGIVAAVAVTKYLDLKGKAEKIAMNAQASAVREGITIYFAKHRQYPEHLDLESGNIYADAAHPFFVNVIQGGVTDGKWHKKRSSGSEDKYKYDADGIHYKYCYSNIDQIWRGHNLTAGCFYLYQTKPAK
jgi:prepilin-type N-terminal cleavage/methylation domain-containing protein